METINLENWSKFERRLRSLRKKAKRAREHAGKYGGVIPNLLYRGHSDASWSLETTLERYSPRIKKWADYYQAASEARHEIESLTERRFELPEYDKLLDWVSNEENAWTKALPGYAFLLYLRHHGYPSPLLDWSRSPYVAAFFAFNNATPSKDIAIYAYWASSIPSKVGGGGEPTIYTQGSAVTTHARHVRQQGDYTICVSAPKPGGEIHIAKHEDVFAQGIEHQDLLWKFILPASQRADVLSYLDSYNLNAFSLFQTEDALLETTAMRSLLFR